MGISTSNSMLENTGIWRWKLWMELGIWGSDDVVVEGILRVFG
jgi:hypothetical protein